jgi:hypothetical protein
MRWREKYVPKQWRAHDQHILFVRANAPDLNDKYGEMFDELAKSGCPSGVLPGLALELVRQGEAARAWIAAGGLNADANERRRKEDARFLKEISHLSFKAKHLAKYLEQEPSVFPVLAALRSTGLRIVSIKHEPLSRGTALAEFLQSYAAALPGSHTAGRGPFLHRTVIGPFVFPEAIDGPARRRGAAVFQPSTAVMFGAVLAARQATGKGGGQAGDLMPKTGQPLYAVAAALVRAVNNEPVSPEEVRTRLNHWIRRNPKVGWMDWPSGDT